MTANVSTMSFTPTGADTTRSLGLWSSDMFLNVKNFGAIGDGSHDDTTNIQNCLDAAFGTTASPHDTNVYLNKPVFFPAGNYKITSALTMRSVRGGHLFGAARVSTRIFNATADGSVFVTNGCDYSEFSGMSLEPNGTGIAFDLDWDNSGGVALQSNTFRDMNFGGGAYGLSIGKTGYMGSENTIQNCYFNQCSVAGLATRNGNALQQCVFGGNFASCDKGIWVASGSCPVIHGVGFQNNDEDIGVDNNVRDGYSIHACRNENSLVSGTVFVRMQNGSSANITGCTHLAETPTVFGWIEDNPGFGAGPGVMTVDNCYSTNGTFVANGFLYIRGNPYPPKAVTGAVSNGGPNLIRLTVVGHGLSTGDTNVQVKGVGGVAAADGNWTITVIDPNTIDLQGSTFSGTYTTGGVVGGTSFHNPAYLSSFTGTVVQNI
jgi:hypothetical protein